MAHLKMQDVLAESLLGPWATQAVHISCQAKHICIKEPADRVWCGVCHS